jgi:two-component system, OmpR family, sensor histidine kinase KdpD
VLAMEFVRRYLFSAAIFIVVTILAWILRETLTLANFTTIYVLVVLVIAINHGTVLALIAAVVSFLCINFFLVRPYYTFVVADPREILDLIVFLVVAMLTGQLAARARQQKETARQRAYEQEILYRLTRSFNQITTSDEVYKALTHMLQTDLAARQAHILPYATDTISPDQTVYYLLLQAGEKIYATLCVAFDDKLTSQQERLNNACASQAAMALYRIDLTERARKSQQFEEADRLKTAILHAVSHDLRTPITIIKTSANNLRDLRERLSPTERDELATTIETEAAQLDKLVGNLLDMSRLQAGAFQLNSDLNSLEEVAGEAAARVWQLTKQERIKIVFADSISLVRFDYGLILQALSNILDNALRYESPDRLIEIQGCVQDDEAQIRVVNHGEAILESEREHIMEPFYRGKEGHVGLGLPIAKGIVEAHYGRLDVEDTPGGGVTFVIGLPIEKQKL